MTKTSATSTTTAFNIFLSKCREEQKVMFPKEKLGKPNTHCDCVLQSTCLRRRAPHKEMYWEVEKDGWPTEEMVYLPRDRRKEIQVKSSRCHKAQDSAQNIYSYSEKYEAPRAKYEEEIHVVKKSLTRLWSLLWWHFKKSVQVISFLLVIHNQCLYDIWSIKMRRVSIFLFLSRMTRCNNSDHTTPSASAFIWSPAIFVFITHSAVTGTHTAILVTSRHRDERVDQSKECQVMLHHQSSVLSPHKCLQVCRRYCGAELSYWPRPRIVHCPLVAGEISLVRNLVLCTMFLSDL